MGYNHTPCQAKHPRRRRRATSSRTFPLTTTSKRCLFDMYHTKKRNTDICRAQGRKVSGNTKVQYQQARIWLYWYLAASGDRVSECVQKSFGIMRIIVTAGWAIYPVGYVIGHLSAGNNDSALNLVYNLADFVNKIGFCLAIWSSAKTDTMQIMA